MKYKLLTVLLFINVYGFSQETDYLISALERSISNNNSVRTIVLTSALSKTPELRDLTLNKVLLNAIQRRDATLIRNFELLGSNLVIQTDTGDGYDSNGILFYAIQNKMWTIAETVLNNYQKIYFTSSDKYYFAQIIKRKEIDYGKYLKIMQNNWNPTYLIEKANGAAEGLSVAIIILLLCDEQYEKIQSLLDSKQLNINQLSFFYRDAAIMLTPLDIFDSYKDNKGIYNLGGIYGSVIDDVKINRIKSFITKNGGMNTYEYIKTMDITSLLINTYYAQNNSFNERFVGTDVLNIREEPNTTSRIVGKLNNSDYLIEITSSTREISISGLQGYWIYIVTAEGIRGWVFDAYLDEKIAKNYQTMNW